MPVHKMKFVLVNDMASPPPSVCAKCSRPLEWGYLHDLSTASRYCGIDCYPERISVGGLGGWITLTYPFGLAIDWRKLTDQIAAELLENAQRDQGD